jgi:hypothetical protein
MAEDFLAAMAGLAEGVDIGLERRREQKNVDAERAFRLKRFNADMSRAAVLDALNEEVQKSRLALQERVTQLQEDRAEREAAQLVEVPVQIGSQTFQMPKQAAARLSELEAQLAMQRQQMFESPYGFLAPEFAANQARMSDEEREKRSFAIKEMVGDFQQSLMQAGMDEDTARYRALRFGKGLFPDEFMEMDPEEFRPKTPEELRAEQEGLASERPFGLMDRLQLVAGGTAVGHPGFTIAGLSPDPAEALRTTLFGPAPPQTRDELLAAREAEAARAAAMAAQDSQVNRALSVLPTAATAAPGTRKWLPPLLRGK